MWSCEGRKGTLTGLHEDLHAALLVSPCRSTANLERESRRCLTDGFMLFSLGFRRRGAGGAQKEINPEAAESDPSLHTVLVQVSHKLLL